jgi:hypothetical protein
VILRQGVQQMLEAAVEAEVADHVEPRAGLTDARSPGNTVVAPDIEGAT